MNKKMFSIVILSIFLLGSFNVFGVSINKERDNKDSHQTQTSSVPLPPVIVEIGSMTIGENSITFNAGDKTILTDYEAMNLTIVARIYFKLGGYCDHGYAYLGLWDQPYEDAGQSGGEGEIVLILKIPNCKPGDTKQIELRGEYEDCINKDFSENMKITVMIKKEIADLWPIEAWVSTTEDDWDKEHVVTKVKTGEPVYYHLRYNILYTWGEKYPHFRIYYVVRPKELPYGGYTDEIPSSTGTGAAKELRYCTKIEAEILHTAGTCSIIAYLDNPYWHTGQPDNPYHDNINEINENNNEITMYFSVESTSKSMNVSPSNLFERFSEQFQLLKQFSLFSSYFL